MPVLFHFLQVREMCKHFKIHAFSISKQKICDHGDQQQSHQIHTSTLIDSRACRRWMLSAVLDRMRTFERWVGSLIQSCYFISVCNVHGRRCLTLLFYGSCARMFYFLIIEIGRFFFFSKKGYISFSMINYLSEVVISKNYVEY